jgi:hypothetical protein
MEFGTIALALYFLPAVIAEPAAPNLSLTSPPPAKKGEIRLGRGRTQGGGRLAVLASAS